MTDLEKAELAHDAAQLRDLKGHAGYPVLVKYLGKMQGDALAQLTNPNQQDQATHHWRGVYTAVLDVTNLADRVIRMHKQSSED